MKERRKTNENWKCVGKSTQILIIWKSNTNQKKVYVVLLMSDKVDFDAKALIETKEDIS